MKDSLGYPMIHIDTWHFIRGKIEQKQHKEISFLADFPWLSWKGKDDIISRYECARFVEYFNRARAEKKFFVLFSYCGSGEGATGQDHQESGQFLVKQCCQRLANILCQINKNFGRPQYFRIWANIKGFVNEDSCRKIPTMNIKVIRR
jgi:hypothetical protein